MSGMQPIPELDAKGYREFALVTGAIVAGLFGLLIPILFWWFGEEGKQLSLPLWPWVICGVLVVWGLLAPTTLKPVYKGWMMFGLFMGTYIMTPLIMSIVFYGMFMPIGLIMRLLGKDGMARKLDQSAASYRVPSSRPPAKNLEKPF